MSECTCRHCGYRFAAEPVAKHRVACGDATNRADFEALIAGEACELLACDPPYNVGLDYSEESDDNRSAEAYVEFTRRWFDAARAVSERQIVTPGCNNLSMWLRLYQPHHVAPWTKANAMTNGKISHFWCWEPILFFGERWSRTRANDIFDFPAGTHKDTGGHPCPKPVRMWADLLAHYCAGAGSVLDCFLGSGTTLVAGEQTDRRVLGMDISPGYVDVAILRWMKLTGRQPVLAATGQTYEEVRGERLG
jgi:hypothetical protein